MHVMKKTINKQIAKKKQSIKPTKIPKGRYLVWGMGSPMWDIWNVWEDKIMYKSHEMVQRSSAYAKLLMRTLNILYRDKYRPVHSLQQSVCWNFLKQATVLWRPVPSVIASGPRVKPCSPLNSSYYTCQYVTSSINSSTYQRTYTDWW